MSSRHYIDVAEERIAAYKAWERDCKEIKAVWERHVLHRRSQWIQKQRSALTEDCKAFCKEQSDIIAAQEATKVEAEHVLSTLGIVQFGQKKAQKTIIQNAVEAISKAREAIEIAQEDVREALAKVEERFNSEGREQLLAQLADEMPLPKSPVETPFSEQYERVKAAVLDLMESVRLYTRDELKSECASINILNLRKLIEEGILEEIVDVRMVYYRRSELNAGRQLFGKIGPLSPRAQVWAAEILSERKDKDCYPRTTKPEPRQASCDVLAVPKNITYREENGQLIRNVELDFPELSPEELTEFVRELEKAGIAKKITPNSLACC